MPLAIYSLDGSGDWAQTSGMVIMLTLMAGLYLYMLTTIAGEYSDRFNGSRPKESNGFALDSSCEIGNEVAVLIGYSDAGKSLTLQLIAGLMKPDSGVNTINRKACFDSTKNIDIPPQNRSFG